MIFCRNLALMKKGLLLLAFSWNFGAAQNYQPVYSNTESFYNHNVTYTIEITGIKPDSVSVIGADTVLHHYRVMADTSMPVNLDECIDGLVFDYPSWQGVKTIIKPSGKHVFFNLRNDSIFVDAACPAGQSWIMHRFATGDYIRANVLSKQYATVNGISDTIKSINLQAYNISNTPINHTVNGVTLKLSRSKGWLKCLNLVKFPNDTVTYTIEPAKRLTRNDIYDFNLGDQFHTTVSGSNGPPPEHKYTILTKTPGANSVLYQVNDVVLTYTFTGGIPPYQSSVATNTVTWNYNNLSSYVFAGMPDQAYPDSLYYPYSMHYAPYRTCGAGYSVVRQYWDSYYYYDTCYKNVYEPVWSKTHYDQGLGDYPFQDFSAYGPPNMPQSIVLKYYYNAAFGNGCGNPLTFGIGDIHEPGLIVYPNPANSHFFIEGLKDIDELRLIDILGREFKCELLRIDANKWRVDINRFEKGLYYIKVNTGKIFSYTIFKE